MAELEIWTDPLSDSNCYLLGEAGAAVVIDPGGAEGPIKVLESHGWTAELILLTHEHCDHMAGLDCLRERYPKACVVTSAACSAGLQDKRLNMSSMMEVYLTYHGKPGVRYPAFICRPADVTYAQSWTGAWRGHSLRCAALPGHTPGSAGIFWDETTFFSGDYLIPGEEVILRLPGGKAEDYERYTKPFLARLAPGLRVCPGHGAAFTLTREDMSAYGLL